MAAEDSLFTYFGGRKKRQIAGPEFECTSFDNCGDHSFEGLTFDMLNVTEEHNEFCNGDRTCIYDLILTGEEEFAATTLQAAEESDMIQALIGRLLSRLSLIYK